MNEDERMSEWDIKNLAIQLLLRGHPVITSWIMAREFAACQFVVTEKLKNEPPF